MQDYATDTDLNKLTNVPNSWYFKVIEDAYNKVEEFIDTMPSQFVNVINDSSFYTKILINSGIDAGVIKKEGNKYSTIDGLELCNAGEIPTFDNAVNYLDSVKNQEVRNIIEAKINKGK